MAADPRRAGPRANRTPALARQPPALKIDDVVWPIPKDYDSFFVVYGTIKDLATGKVLSENEYVHSAHHSSVYPLSVLLGAPKTELRLEMTEQGADTAQVAVANLGPQRAAVPAQSSRAAGTRSCSLAKTISACRRRSAKVAVQAIDPSNPAWRPDFNALAVKAWNSEESRVR